MLIILVFLYFSFLLRFLKITCSEKPCNDVSATLDLKNKLKRNMLEFRILCGVFAVILFGYISFNGMWVFYWVENENQNHMIINIFRLTISLLLLVFFSIMLYEVVVSYKTIIWIV